MFHFFKKNKPASPERQAPVERRTPLEPFDLSWETPIDSLIKEICDRLAKTRTRQIIDAICGALKAQMDAKLPANPFRTTDTLETAFPLVVAADQKQAILYNPATPPRFTSAIRNLSSYKDPETGKYEPRIFSSTADSAYCAAIKAAIKALITRQVQSAVSPPGPETSATGTATPTSPDQVTIPPPSPEEPATYANHASSPDQPAPGSSPETPLGTPIPVAPPASDAPAPAPDITDTPLTSPVNLPDQKPPLGTEEWWSDDKWPDPPGPGDKPHESATQTARTSTS